VFVLERSARTPEMIQSGEYFCLLFGCHLHKKFCMSMIIMITFLGDVGFVAVIWWDTALFGTIPRWWIF
jgi:hypothetical protein